MKKMVAAAACCLLSAPVWAADSGFYFGVSGGATSYDFESVSMPVIGAGQPNSSFRPPSDSISVVAPPAFAGPVTGTVGFLPIGWLPGDDDDGSAWGITAGYRIFRYAAVELNYLNLGTLKESRTVNIFPFPNTTELRRELETSGPTFSVLGTLPIVGGWSVYARAGVLFAEMNLESSIGASSGDTSFASQNMLWGLGTQFDWGDHWSLRLDFQRFESVGEVFDAGEADIELLTFGVLYRL